MGTNQGDDPQPSGGIEVYVDALIKKLAQEKSLEFIVITRKFKKTKSYDKNDNIEVYRVRWFKGFYFRNISFNLMSFFKALTLDFEIIFSQDTFATLFGIILSRLKKKPLVAVVHGTASNQPQYPGVLRSFLKKLERFAFLRTDFTISLSEETKKFFQGYIVKNGRWNVIPFGVETKRFKGLEKSKSKDDLGLEKNAIVITFVGRLLRVKGVSYLIEALSSIQESFSALIVGSGPDEDKLIKLVGVKKLEDKVHFLGFRTDIPKILAATDIFVLPSISEGLSISLLEAKAAGCAIVATEIGLPVEHGKNALVVKPRDPDGLSVAIKQLIIDEKLRKTLGDNAKKDAEKNYSWDNVVEQYLEIFKSLEHSDPE